MSRPLATIITATWGRPRTILERAIPSVRAQDYGGEIEHLIVTDGHDRSLNKVLEAAGYSEEAGSLRRVISMGRNWSMLSGDGGMGAIPRLIGSFMAAGEYIGYLDDDNAYLPCHVSALVSALEETGADFAYSRWLHAGTDGLTGGQAPPGRTRTDSSAIMHRAATLKHGSWWMDGYEADGVLAERWLAAGCSWAFVDEPTLILYPHRCGAPDDLEG